MRNIKLFKVNEDDILEIVSEYFAESTGIEEFYFKSIVLGTPNKDLRMIIAVSDEICKELDLVEVDKNMAFNGDHSHIKGLNDTEMVTALKTLIEKWSAK